MSSSNTRKTGNLHYFYVSIHVPSLKAANAISFLLFFGGSVRRKIRTPRLLGKCFTTELRPSLFSLLNCLDTPINPSITLHKNKEPKHTLQKLFKLGLFRL